jgi:hypothetical protein
MILCREYQGGMSAGKKTRGGAIQIHLLQTVPTSCGQHLLKHQVLAATKIERGHSQYHPVLSKAPDSISARPFLRS